MRRAGPEGRRAGGFTFVELVLALAVGAVVIAGMYEGFNILHRWWITAGVTSDQRQNARVALETVTRDLEMAGYQTTNYGDVNKTGIAITFASANEIEMDQQRPTSATLGSPTPVFEPRLVYYHLATDIQARRQNLYRQIRTQPGLPTPDQLVAENVSEFSLEYFDEDNGEIAGVPPASPGGSAAYTPGVAVPANSPLRAIRRIQVTLTTIPSRTSPVGPPGRAFTLKASVMPQNLGAADETMADDTPPAPPSGPTVLSAGPPAITGPAVIDTRSCSAKLRVKWNANTEPDLAGYTVYYGPTNRITVSVRALPDKSAPEVTLNPNDLFVTKNADRATAPNTYAIQVSAYDSAGNHSLKSGAVSGDPSPDVWAFGGANDTTVNPLKPSAPTGMSVLPGAADGELVVSWQAPADGTATAGYRLYRGTAAFADGHIDNALQLVSEATLSAEVTTYTDRNLEGCRPYYYAVASVNCDETLVDGYLYNSDNPALSDYAVGSGAPADTVPPPAPSLAGSAPDFQRAFVTLTNPLAAEAPDFDRTEIYWSKIAPGPTLAGAAVSDGTHLPDGDGTTEGTFRNRGSQVVVFDSETEASPLEPSLIAGTTYFLLAVNFDRCGNPSLPEARSLSISGSVPAEATCVDDPPGPPPFNFTTSGYSSCQQASVVIEWDYTGAEMVADFAGFRVERTGPDGTIELTSGPTLRRSWADAGPLQAGATYSYSVKATDCLYDPLLYSLNATSSFPIGTANPGGLQRYQPLSGTDHELEAANFVTSISDQTAPYTYHNNVKFFLQNTSRSAVTLKKLSAAWDNPNVVLDQVVLGGAPSSTTEQTFSAGGAASGGALTLNSVVTDVAGGIGDPSGPIPVVLRFTTVSGIVNRLADMRNERLDLSLWIWNNSLQDATCSVADKLLIDVPRGPVLGGFSQSAPGKFGIDSYEVVGASGTARDTDIKVPYGIDVNVFGTAFDYSRELFPDRVNRGFATLKLVGINAEPAAPDAVPSMPVSGTFFERPLYGTGGDRYAIYRASPEAMMPQISNEVLWYYALAVDHTGNWDRAPGPDSGSFAYFQPPFDVCAATPQAPELTLTSSTSTVANLAWTIPTSYVDGVAIVESDSLTYDVYVKNAGGAPWPSAPAETGLVGSSYSHNADLLTGTYYYTVRAKNSCTPTPRPSGDSNIVMECEGDANLDCSLFNTPGTARYNEPIVLTVSVFCASQGNGIVDSVVFRIQSGATSTDFSVTETGDTGVFAKTITAVWSGGGGDAVAAPSGSLGVTLLVGGASQCSTRTITLQGGACFTTPNPPTTVAVVRGLDGSGTAVLTWIKPNYNTDGSPLVDLAGYDIGMARCATYNSGTGTCTIWSDWSLSALNSPIAQAHTYSGLVTGERYKFRVRAKDSCSTPNTSTWSSETSTIRLR